MSNAFHFNSKKTVALAGSVLLVGFFALFLNFKTIDITENAIIDVYDDSNNGGSTKSSFSTSNSAVCYDYTLGNKLENPFSGIRFKKKELMNFTSSDMIAINFSKPFKKNKIIHIKFAIKTKDNLERIFSLPLECNSSKLNYEINISDFATPAWWYRDNHVLESNMEAPDYSKVIFLGIQNDILISKGEADRICISSIRLLKNNSSVFIWLFLSLLVFNSAIVIGIK